MDYQGYRSNEPYRGSSQRYQQPQSSYSKSYQSQQGNYRNKQQENYSEHYQPQHENNLYGNQQPQRNFFDSYQGQTNQARYNQNSGGGSSYSEGLYQRRSDTDFGSTSSCGGGGNFNDNSFPEHSRPNRDRYKPYDLDSRGTSESRGNYKQQNFQSGGRGRGFRGSQQFSHQSAASNGNNKFKFGGVNPELESEVKREADESDFVEHDDLEDHFDEEVDEEEADFGLYEDANHGEDEGDDIGSQEGFQKINPYTPDSSTIEKHLVHPPSTEELREMLSDLVIYFFYKNKNVPEKNHFVVLCESFRKSARYSDLNIEDGYDRKDKFRKYTTLKWHGMIMSRGASEYGNLKEPRVRASVELINKLAQFCYTLKAKDSYFSNEAFQRLLDTKEMPGVFKVVPQDQVRNESEIDKYMDSFFMNDTDCELIFTDKKLHFPVLRYAKNKGYSIRKPRQGQGFTAVSKTRSPQYWRDKILSSGQMENEKFVLVPPQGVGRNLLEDFDILECVPCLNRHVLPPPQTGKKPPQKKPLCTTNTPVPQLYGPEGVGPSIVLAKPPWRSQSFQRRGKKFFNKKNKNKFKKNKKYKR